MSNLIKKIWFIFASVLYSLSIKIQNAYWGNKLDNLSALLSGDKRALSLRKDSCFYGVQFISIKAGFSCGKDLRIEALDHYNDQQFTPKLEIGEHVYIGDFGHIGCIEHIEIGDGVMMGSKVYITDHFHGNISASDLQERPALRPLSSKPVFIGKNVWIGDNAVIMPGVKLEENVIVGANAVVTHSFPANSVIAGCPAKLIRTLE